jgi:hypothetical protein
VREPILAVGLFIKTASHTRRNALENHKQNVLLFLLHQIFISLQIKFCPHPQKISFYCVCVCVCVCASHFRRSLNLLSLLQTQQNNGRDGLGNQLAEDLYLAYSLVFQTEI